MIGKKSQKALLHLTPTLTQDADFATLENHPITQMCLYASVCGFQLCLYRCVSAHVCLCVRASARICACVFVWALEVFHRVCRDMQLVSTHLFYTENLIQIPLTWSNTHTHTHTHSWLQRVKVQGPCVGMFVLHNDLIVLWYGLSEPCSVAESHLFHLCQRADKARDASISI